MTEKIQIDLLNKKTSFETRPKSRIFLFARIFMVTIIFSAVAGAAFSYQIVTQSEDDEGGFFNTIRSFVTSDDKQLEGEENNRINILMLGIGGAGHEGPDLTDTIIFGSLETETKEVAMMSLPRDLTIPFPDYGWRKVNHANYFGELQCEGCGPQYAADAIGDVLDQDIQYYVRVDFTGFEKLIDDLGGIEVFVDRSFTDDTFPTDDYEIQTVSFQAGWQHMDGEDALQFARSRHGTNGEGSDFARSQRQQKIIIALKEKVFSASTLINPVKINRILDTLSDHIETNFSTWEIIKLARIIKDIDTSKVNNYVIDDSPDSPLYATNLNGAYVLLPKNDDWVPLQSIASTMFSGEATDAIETETEDKPKFVKIEIQNGTEISGLAFQTSQLLQGQGFDIVKIGNADEREYRHTVTYDLTSGQKTEELILLQEYLMADISMSVPGWIYTNEIVPKEITITNEDQLATEENIDFLVILGENSANLVKK